MFRAYYLATSESLPLPCCCTDPNYSAADRRSWRIGIRGAETNIKTEEGKKIQGVWFDDALVLLLHSRGTSNCTCPDRSIYLCPKVKPRVGASLYAPVGAPLFFGTSICALVGACFYAPGATFCALVGAHLYAPGALFVPWSGRGTFICPRGTFSCPDQGTFLCPIK